jgi:hypothetical protein
MQVSSQLYLVRTKQEAADLLDVSRQTVHKWEKEGPVAFYPVGLDWLVEHLPDEEGLRRTFGQHSHAYVIGSIPRDIELKQRLGRFRAIRVPPSSLPGYRADPNTR